MLIQPFHPIFLTFYQQHHEDLFEELQMELRLKLLKLLTLTVFFVSLSFLIISIIQGQPLILIIIFGILIFISVNWFLLANKLKPYIQYLLPIAFIINVTVSSYITGYQDNKYIFMIFSGSYIYGFGSSILQLIIISTSHIKTKVFLIIIGPIIQCIVCKQFTFYNIQFVVFQLFCTILLIIYLFAIELSMRTTFSRGIIIKKQEEIINEFINIPLIAISLNDRTRQFEIVLKNKKIEEQFNINDVDQLKNMLRNKIVYINDQEQEEIKSIFNKVHKNQMILEEFLNLFLLDQSNLQYQIQNLKCHNQQNKILNIQIRKIDYMKPTLIITIQQNINLKENQQQNEQCKLIIQLFQNLAQQIFNNYEELKNIQYHQQNILLSINHYSILNQLRNNIIYFSQDIILNQQNYIKQINFQEYWSQIYQFLSLKIKHKQQQLILTNLINNSLNLKINTQYLSQIIINIFEKSLSQCLLSCPITITLRTLQNDIITSNQSKFIIDEKTIEFEISYYILTSQNNQDKKNDQFQNQISVNQYVTNILVGIIGPFNQIDEQIIEQGDLILKKIKFQFYIDQSQLEQSFMQTHKRSSCFNNIYLN